MYTQVHNIYCENIYVIASRRRRSKYPIRLIRLYLMRLQGRCNREKPPCKYFHPPQHLKDQLLINGRNHLALKNALMQQMTMAASQQIVPGQVPTAVVSSLHLYIL